MIYSATTYAKLGTDTTTKTMQVTEQQRQFLLSLLQDINGISVFVDRETFDDETANQAADMVEDLKYKILAAI
jgi:hypothetical protein